HYIFTLSLHDALPICFPKGDLDLEELEFSLIDFGLEEIAENEGEIFVYTEFGNFGNMQKALEDMNVEVTSAEFEWFPMSTTELRDRKSTRLNSSHVKI